MTLDAGELKERERAHLARIDELLRILRERDDCIAQITLESGELERGLLIAVRMGEHYKRRAQRAEAQLQLPMPLWRRLLHRFDDWRLARTGTRDMRRLIKRGGK